MSVAALLFVLGALALIAWSAARARVAGFGAAAPAFDPPRYHGWYAAAWTFLPAALVLAAWSALSPALGTRWVLGDLPAAAPPTLSLVELLSKARALAAGGMVTDPLAAAYARVDAKLAWIGTAGVLLVALAGAGFALVRVRPALPARAKVERIARAVLVMAALTATAVTTGIVVALLIESLRFFHLVPPAEFLFGTRWSPQVIDPANPGASLGALPLLWGTFFIGAIIAMAVAVPLGLMSAIYLGHYAAARTRRHAKPVLELLAGIPTVVYGYVAVLIVAPAVRDLGVTVGIENASTESALAAGLVMGVMLIPLVSSLSDDAFAAVPRELRDASLALGATLSETVRGVLLPAALPGIVGGILLAVSRAIGETMIVVMVASGVATLTANPFAPTTTVTKQIVDLLTGEAAFDSAKTLAAFALGLTLFVLTLGLNIVALVIVRRHRAAYD